MASEVTVTSRILLTHSLSSSWVLAAMSSTWLALGEVAGSRENTWGRLPFPSGLTTGEGETQETGLGWRGRHRRQG